MRSVLLTGFPPFGGDAFNPSSEVVRALDGRVVEGRRVVSAILPCVFGDAIAELGRLLDRVDPELVVCTGLDASRSGVTLERIAINLVDARIPDNLGAQPVDEPIVADGPVGYWSTLPIRSIARALRDAGIPIEISQSAGTFVCNHVFYGLMHRLAGTSTRGGFIHLPNAHAQVAPDGTRSPSLSIDAQVRAIELAIATALASS